MHSKALCEVLAFFAALLMALALGSCLIIIDRANNPMEDIR